MQEKPPPGLRPRPAATPPEPGSAEAATVKPVMPAAAAKRAKASVIGMIMAAGGQHRRVPADRPDEPGARRPTATGRTSTSAPSRGRPDVAGFTPVAADTGDSSRPTTPAGSPAAGSGVPAWEVGYLTPGRSPSSDWSRPARPIPPGSCQQTNSAPVTGTRKAGGQDWELRDTGKGEKSMVLERGGTTVILTRNGELDEFAVLAAAVVKSLDSKSTSDRRHGCAVVAAPHRKVAPWLPI